MATRKRFLFAGVATIFGAGFMLGSTMQGVQDVQAQSAARVFELRTYTTPEGKLPNLQARFRDHTMSIFEKHGITNVAYWMDAPGRAAFVEYAYLHHRAR